MYGLALDTSNKLQLALLKDGVIIDSFSMAERINISDVLLQYISNMLNRNQIILRDLNFIALINGAGYFTGVRIAIVVAKVLHLALNIPVFTFSASFVMFKEAAQDSFVVAAVDIGKRGCVIAVFHENKQIIADIYIDEDDLENFFKQNEVLCKILPENFMFVGNKQSLFKEISYFKSAAYLQNITAPSMKILGDEAVYLYDSGKFMTNIEPLYAKEVDMIIKDK